MADLPLGPVDQSEALRIGKGLGIDFAQVDLDQFQQGMEVEQEHASDPDTDVAKGDIEVCAKIAWAHLKEDPRYYTHLAAMENKSSRFPQPKLSEESSMPTSAMQNAMKHSNALGAGAKARKHLKGQAKVGVVMHEFKRGTLHSGGSGKIVKNRKQAIAIAMSEAGMAKRGRKSSRPRPF
jgi:hypothetical protein